MEHEDGRVATIPIHAGKIIAKALLRKILRDTEISIL
ncbi:MAG: type II toxin-antitoxin system HicA family toxin [Hassallia sp.]